MSRNIVICCDGTGNEIGANISNVLKLYRIVQKSPSQIVFYDPGVGTLARPDPFTKFQQDAKAVLGLATGYGLDDNVLAAYEFLIDHYQDGDAVYLFGFSRGAHTVRVLAGFLHMMGLLAPEQKILAGYALTAYKKTSESGAFEDAWQFARIVSSRWLTIKFIGVWDTVASMIVPRPDRFYTFSLLTLPYTQKNPNVQIFRQAMAIDERRRMFRLSPWDDQQEFVANRFSKPRQSVPQDVKQVWFAGVHSDVGGGYPEKESGLSKFPLLWMIGEATAKGLVVNTATLNHLAKGVPRAGSRFTYVAPDVRADPHDSMTAGWRVLEWIPKANKYKEWPARKSVLGHYIPAAEPRPIPDNAFVHESVIRRTEQVPAYRPVNLPPRYQVVPMDAGTVGAEPMDSHPPADPAPS
jgi:uncharacterized protein (DUF2235 family)